MNFKKLKKTAAAVLLAGGLTVGTVPAASAGGITVVDPTAVGKLVSQIENQVKQIEELRNQVKAVTGNRNLGNILQTEALEQLPDEWKKVYESAKGFKDGNYKDLLSSKGYNPNADNERLTKQFDLSLRAIKDSQVRVKNIKALMNQANQTKDAKAAADLQNRIALENGIIQQNQTSLDILARHMELEEKVQMKKRAERNSCIRQNRINNTNKSCG
ncbi:type IV secretion system protein [Neisseria sp.]|uniref:type IV secretion system protein n=1 Tax=Neisseria sp. TaxID=192066 RepID=UPI0035A0758B